MLEITGKYNTAKVFASIIEETAKIQIEDLCNQQWLQDCFIAIMPDVHAGSGCTIGTTILLHDKVCPSLVGVDIACGMFVMEIPQEFHINPEDLPIIDEFINNHIPSGFHINEECVLRDKDKELIEELKTLHVYKKLKKPDYILKSIGSLGGGNHFIEIDESNNKQYLVVHSGSRNLGQQVASLYQNIADAYCNRQEEQYQECIHKIIDQLKSEGRYTEIEQTVKNFKKSYVAKEYIPHDLCYLEGDLAQEYFDDVKITTKYAKMNRKYMILRILEYIAKMKGYEENIVINEVSPCIYELQCGDVCSRGFETLHNYIDFTNTELAHPVLRKGAISAKKDEIVLIPINMRDGAIIGKGKGNNDYNQSGPHGAGRLMSRKQARENIDIEAFEASMTGIYSTSINLSTIDESPFAYKSIEDILDNISDSVDIIDIIKPIYNFKAHE